MLKTLYKRAWRVRVTEKASQQAGNLGFLVYPDTSLTETRMSWERVGIKVTGTEHRVSGDSKSRAAPPGMRGQEWTWGSECPSRAQYPPWYPRRAGVVTITGSVVSPAVIRQGEVWSIQEYISSKSKQQKPETGLVLPTSWLSLGVGART